MSISKTLLALLVTATPALALADEPAAGTPAAPVEAQPPAPVVPETTSVPAPVGVVATPMPVEDESPYGQKGQMEIGVSAGLMASSTFHTVSLAPSIGWFAAENLELSATLMMTNVKAGDTSATTWSALAEPSYHIPISTTTIAFLGMGVGAAYQSSLGTGLAIAPRVGVKFLIGKSGVLTPSLQYEYVTHDAMTSADANVLALTSAMAVNVGYSALF